MHILLSWVLRLNYNIKLVKMEKLSPTPPQPWSIYKPPLLSHLYTKIPSPAPKDVRRDWDCGGQFSYPAALGHPACTKCYF
jgi:hypothetical protein